MERYPNMAGATVSAITRLTMLPTLKKHSKLSEMEFFVKMNFIISIIAARMKKIILVTSLISLTNMDLTSTTTWLQRSLKDCTATFLSTIQEQPSLLAENCMT